MYKEIAILSWGTKNTVYCCSEKLRKKRKGRHETEITFVIFLIDGELGYR